MKNRVLSYTVLVSMVATVAVAAVARDGAVPDWRLTLFLGALSFLAECFAFRIPFGGSVSLAFAIEFAAVLLGGPLMGAIVCVCSAIPPQDIVARKPPLRMLFNVSQLALSGVVAGLTLSAFGVAPLLLQPTPALSLQILVAALAAAAVQALTNMLLVAGAISLSADVPFREVWRQSFSSYSVSLVVLALLGIVLAQLLLLAGLPGALLVVVPFAVSRQTFQVYRHLSESYRDTLRSLIAVLEAKDPYTRGHSERVAFYARQIADGLSLGPESVQTIELAALLHDIGKVGVSVATLTKPAALTSEEYGEVKLHPLSGAQVLEGIDFLAEVVPLIAAHHERMDGSGYPLGLVGSGLPEGAKVLAVADTFDAITSDRAYRRALPFSEAADVVRRAAGDTLDQSVVEALLVRVDADVLARVLRGDIRWEART
ncbi:MAG: HD-GYP domain-containing protein [Actinomycetota bacterium]|nr:HD-GYP domain-containing protein [Actinomycetota bacterium]